MVIFLRNRRRKAGLSPLTSYPALVAAKEISDPIAKRQIRESILMRKPIALILAGVMVASSVVIAGAPTASAAVTNIAPATNTAGNVARDNAAGASEVQYRRGGYYRGGPRHYRGGRHYNRGHYYRGGRHHGPRVYRDRRRSSSGAAAAGAIIGLGAGAIIGGALANQNRAQASDWHAYCASRFRSYNPNTGMYRTYDGRLVPCR